MAFADRASIMWIRGGERGKEVKTREMAGDQLYDQWLKKHNYCPFLQQICLYHPNTDTII